MSSISNQRRNLAVATKRATLIAITAGSVPQWQNIYMKFCITKFTGSKVGRQDRLKTGRDTHTIGCLQKTVHSTNLQSVCKLPVV
jgi:hypothetical protein